MIDLEVLKTVAKYAINYRRARREHARRLFFLLSHHFTPVMASDEGPARIFFETRDPVIGWEVFKRGTFDDEYTREVLRLLEIHGCGEARTKTFVDIGANIGTACITAVVRDGFPNALAFEPTPSIFKILQLNILANDLGAVIRPYRIAFSDEDSEAALELAAECSGSNRLLSRQAEPEPGLGTMRVPVSTFDSFAGEAGVDVSTLGLVWMDVQGCEGHILKGARSLLESRVPVVLEYAPYHLERAGGMDLLEECIAGWYSRFIDIRAAVLRKDDRAQPASEVAKLRQRYSGPEFTDLLLLK